MAVSAGAADGATHGRGAALLRGPWPERDRFAVGAFGEHGPVRPAAGVDDVEGVVGVNELDDLDQLEQECGPALRVALRRVAAEISVDTPASQPGPSVRFLSGEHAALDEP